MSVDFGSMTFGRNQTTTQQTIENYNQYFSQIKSALTGSDKDAFVNAIRNSWEGVDADAFLKRLEDRIQEIDAAISTLPSKIEQSINEDLQEFARFQENNIEAVSAVGAIGGLSIGTAELSDSSSGSLGTTTIPQTTIIPNQYHSN